MITLPLIFVVLTFLTFYYLNEKHILNVDPNVIQAIVQVLILAMALTMTIIYQHFGFGWTHIK